MNLFSFMVSITRHAGQICNLVCHAHHAHIGSKFKLPKTRVSIQKYVAGLNFLFHSKKIFLKNFFREARQF